MYNDKLIFATGNANKIKEVNALLEGKLTVGSLDDIGCTGDLPETHETLHENALEKARYVYNNYGVNCFSEDTGLEVKALNGAPGVYSARYAGSQKNNEDNIDLLLKNMEGEPDRSAQFRTVIALIIDGAEYLFEGTAPGTIIEARVGGGGFGYDPVFQPVGHNRTFAEMDMLEKSKLSHRGQAVSKLIYFLKEI